MKGSNIKKDKREESMLFSKVDGLHIMEKDATLVMTQKREVQRRQVVLEEHYIMVGEPGKYYLGHISTKSEKSHAIAEGIKDAITNTNLEDILKVTATTIKLWERVIEARKRMEVTTAEHQFGFMPGRSTTDTIF